MAKDKKTTGKKRGWLIAAAVVAALAIGGVVGTLASRGFDTAEPLFIEKGDFEFIVEYGSCSLNHYYGSDSEVVIPAYCSGMPVTGIGTGAFDECSAITSVTIPDSVYSIGYRAFCNCDNLTSIKLSENLTRIEDDAFRNCTGLEAVEFPVSLKSIGRNAFYNCDALTSITIPEYVNDIGYEAFAHCDALTSATVTHKWSEMCASQFDLRSFADCYNLKTLTIPTDTRKFLADTPYELLDLNSLEEINIYDANITHSLYSTRDGIVYNLPGNEMIYCPRGRSGNLTIPEGVTFLDIAALSHCDKLTSITIPADLTGICRSNFSSCTNLESFIISEDNPVYRSIDGVVYSKDGSTLLFCPRARSGDLVIPEGVTRISNEAFYYCDQLDSITIPESMESIGEYAFQYTDGIDIHAPHSSDYYGDCSADYVGWYTGDGSF